MDRVVVTGNSCGGKSTLSRRLAAELDLPYVEIDSVVWQADGTYVGDETYAARHAELIAGDRWLIDGVGVPPSLWPRLERASAIVLVDLPLWIHFFRAARRHASWESGGLQHPPAGVKLPPPLEVMFKTIWDVDRQLTPKLRHACKEFAKDGKFVCSLRTVRALDIFTGQHLVRQQTETLTGQEPER